MVSSDVLIKILKLHLTFYLKKNKIKYGAKNHCILWQKEA